MGILDNINVNRELREVFICLIIKIKSEQSGLPRKFLRIFVANDGFTLAEVLITLVIIGVITAITVPSLINKTNNQEYVSRLKRLIQHSLRLLIR